MFSSQINLFICVTALTKASANDIIPIKIIGKSHNDYYGGFYDFTTNTLYNSDC